MRSLGNKQHGRHMNGNMFKTVPEQQTYGLYFILCYLHSSRGIVVLLAEMYRCACLTRIDFEDEMSRPKHGRGKVVEAHTSRNLGHSCIDTRKRQYQLMLRVFSM